LVLLAHSLVLHLQQPQGSQGQLPHRLQFDATNAAGDLDQVLLRDPGIQSLQLLQHLQRLKERRPEVPNNDKNPRPHPPHLQAQQNLLLRVHSIPWVPPKHHRPGEDQTNLGEPMRIRAVLREIHHATDLEEHQKPNPERELLRPDLQPIVLLLDLH